MKKKTRKNGRAMCREGGGVIWTDSELGAGDRVDLFSRGGEC